MFQSHAGSIEAQRSPHHACRHGMFQSHAGSIEAQLQTMRAPVDRLGFNPTLVRLRPSQVQVGSVPINRFNPTLVRLRRPHQLNTKTASRMFQSHAGSIEALTSPARGIVTLTFQSHAGSIEAFHMVGGAMAIVAVSIPRWFD